jgi:O-antigen ligase
MAGMSIGGTIFVSATIACLALSWSSWGRAALREVLSHPLSWATAALFLASLLSLVGAWVFPPLGEPASGFWELKKFHHFLYPPLVALALLHNADQPGRHPFWRVWGVTGLLMFLLAFLQFFGADLFPQSWLEHRFFRSVGDTGRFHGQGLMFFHLSFASCMTFVGAAGLARALWPEPFDGRRDRWFWMAVGAAGFFSVYLSYSRIALVGLVFLGTLLAFLRRPALGALALVLFVAFGSLLWTQSRSLQDRFFLSTGANQERKLLWQAAWEMTKERPVVGFGFGRSGRYTPEFTRRLIGQEAPFTSHAHNNFLDTLASTGVAGLGAYLAWWLVLLVSAWRSFRSGTHRWLAAAALGGLLAFQVNGLTQVNFWDGKSQHTLMIWAGVVLALAVKRKRISEGQPRARA